MSPVLPQGQGTELGIFFGVGKILNIFGLLEIPDIFFLVNGRCWTRAYV